MPSKNMFTLFVQYIQGVNALGGWLLLGRICVLSAVAWGPSVVVAYLTHRIFPAQENPDLFSRPFQFFVGGILVAPLMETLMMRYLFRMLRKVSERQVVLAGLSAALWIPLHAMYVGWGVHAAWPFFVLGLCYLSLEPISFSRAFWVTAAIHALCNALSYGIAVGLAFLGLS